MNTATSVSNSFGGTSYGPTLTAPWTPSPHSSSPPNSSPWQDWRPQSPSANPCSALQSMEAIAKGQDFSDFLDHQTSRVDNVRFPVEEHAHGNSRAFGRATSYSTRTDTSGYSAVSAGYPSAAALFAAIPSNEPYATSGSGWTSDAADSGDLLSPAEAAQLGNMTSFGPITTSVSVGSHYNTDGSDLTPQEAASFAAAVPSYAPSFSASIGSLDTAPRSGEAGRSSFGLFTSARPSFRRPAKIERKPLPHTSSSVCDYDPSKPVGFGELPDSTCITLGGGDEDTIDGKSVWSGTKALGRSIMSTVSRVTGGWRTERKHRYDFFA